jgi:hypothetical protein
MLIVCSSFFWGEAKGFLLLPLCDGGGVMRGMKPAPSPQAENCDMLAIPSCFFQIMNLPSQKPMLASDGRDGSAGACVSPRTVAFGSAGAPIERDDQESSVIDRGDRLRTESTQ